MQQVNKEINTRLTVFLGSASLFDGFRLLFTPQKCVLYQKSGRNVDCIPTNPFAFLPIFGITSIVTLQLPRRSLSLFY